MVQVLRQIGVWIGTGPLAPLAILLAILTTIAALFIVILELSGRTISRRGIVSNGFHWDWTSLVVTVLVAGLVVLTSPIHFDFIHILKNGPRLSPALAPVIAVVFGLPGVFGYLLGVFISDLQGGITAAALFSAVWGTLAWVWVTWLPYMAVRKLNFSSAQAALGTMGRFYLWAVLIGPFFHFWGSPGLSILTGGDPTQVWGQMLPMVTINHDLPFLILGPIALAILYPLAKMGNLYWLDRQRVAASA